jgi:hypothetical protein
MTREERGWHCKLCRKSVYDLSAMTHREAKALLAAKRDLCVAYDVSDAGDIVFAPEPVVPISRLTRFARPAAAAGIALALAACAPHGEDQGPSLDAPDHPAQIESSPVIPQGKRPEPTPFLEVEVEPPPAVDDEPCDVPAVDPEPKVRTVKGKLTQIRHTRGLRRPPPDDTF